MAGSPHFQKVWYLSAISQTFGLKLQILKTGQNFKKLLTTAYYPKKMSVKLDKDERITERCHIQQLWLIIFPG